MCTGQERLPASCPGLDHYSSANHCVNMSFQLVVISLLISQGLADILNPQGSEGCSPALEYWYQQVVIKVIDSWNKGTRKNGDWSENQKTSAEMKSGWVMLCGCCPSMGERGWNDIFPGGRTKSSTPVQIIWVMYAYLLGYWISSMQFACVNHNISKHLAITKSLQN